MTDHKLVKLTGVIILIGILLILIIYLVNGRNSTYIEASSEKSIECIEEYGSLYGYYGPEYCIIKDKEYNKEYIVFSSDEGGIAIIERDKGDNNGEEN